MFHVSCLVSGASQCFTPTRVKNWTAPKESRLQYTLWVRVYPQHYNPIESVLYMGVVESYVSGTNNTFSFVEVQTMGHISEPIHTLARVVSVRHVLKLLVKDLIDCHRRYVWTNYSNSSVYGQWNCFRFYNMHQLMLVLSNCWPVFAYTSSSFLSQANHFYRVSRNFWLECAERHDIRQRKRRSSIIASSFIVHVAFLWRSLFSILIILHLLKCNGFLCIWFITWIVPNFYAFPIRL
jgi:hypothetical protein